MPVAPSLKTSTTTNTASSGRSLATLDGHRSHRLPATMASTEWTSRMPVQPRTPVPSTPPPRARPTPHAHACSAAIGGCSDHGPGDVLAATMDEAWRYDGDAGPRPVAQVPGKNSGLHRARRNGGCRFRGRQLNRTVTSCYETTGLLAAIQQSLAAAAAPPAAAGHSRGTRPTRVCAR